MCGLQALSSLVNKSGVPREYIANVQAGKDGDGRDDESDEEYTEAAAVVDKHRGQLLKVIVDPIRKVLSGALFLYARLDADGAPDLVRPAQLPHAARLRPAACAPATASVVPPLVLRGMLLAAPALVSWM